ncbi:MAG: TetR family transcriptional regulator [Nocardioidaceae bacterium]
MADGARIREGRRRETARRITLCAQTLTRDHGLDGFTMDGLAEAVGVSRRTLFNYFPGKIDAVLGDPFVLRDDHLAQFRAGGPTGDLVTDLGELGTTVLDQFEYTPEQARLGREVFKAEPRLIGLVHQRFEHLAEQLETEIAAREREQHDPRRARVAVRLIAVLFGLSLDRFIAEPGGGELIDHYAEYLQVTRALFH